MSRKIALSIGLSVLLLGPAWADDRAFLRCVGCHGLNANEPPKFGPSLHGIVGRRAASLPDFAYSAEFKAVSWTWTAEQLEQWLATPQAIVPGMCMPFMGIANAEERRALVEYLRQH